MEKIVKNKMRVFVGLSGGVDSAVAATLLKKEGYEVAGVFMRFWKPGLRMRGKIPPNPPFIKGGREEGNLQKEGERDMHENSCCSVESEAKARLAAAKLGIPFYIFDFSKEFKKEVVDYFLRELATGRTPNPCVVCNPQIKFGLFWERAKKLGADFVATGHYARVKKSKGSVKLFTAKDKQKDQSYFLYRLGQEQLSRVIFPLGDYTKDEVYKLAKKWGLPHQARQSFDICFTGDYQGFLKGYVKMKEGEILKFHPLLISPSRVREGEKEGEEICSSREGEIMGVGIRREKAAGTVIGQHQGLPFYTIGQRTSLGGPGPFYVVKKDVKKNILYVSNNERDLYKKETSVENVNWTSGQAPKPQFKCRVKIRYQAKGVEAVIKKQSTINNKQFKIQFTRFQRAITPGQSAVFYSRGGEVLGGGVISGCQTA